MKFVSVYMALYMMLLTVIPCADAAVPRQIYHDTISHSSQSDHGPCDDHDPHSSDGCSPLCVCHCCHTHVYFTEYFLVTTAADYPANPLPINSGHFSSSYLNAPFRPPRS